MEWLLVVLMFLGIVALVGVLMSIPALIVMLGFNWIAPQFGCHVHLGFLQAWIGLWVLGIVGRTIFGSRSSDSK